MDLWPQLQDLKPDFLAPLPKKKKKEKNGKEER